MGLRFRKSFKIAPGVRFSIGAKSSSISFGGNGLRYTINSKGRRTTSVGIPGTGISYVTSSSSKGYHRTKAYSQRQQLQQRQKEITKLEDYQRNRHEMELFYNQIDL
jgi:hypothetical protein